MNKLTNIDITQRLDAIYGIDDFCDRFQALKLFEPEYKKSKFYKQTHCPLAQLYRQYVLEHLLSLRSALHNLQNFVKELDTDNITSLFDSINADTLATITQGISALDETGLADLLRHKKA